MALLLIPLIILIAVVYGGWHLIKDVRAVKILSIHGALFAFVCLCRYAVYFIGLATSIVVYAILLVPKSNRTLSFDHEFNIDVNESAYSIVRSDTNETDISLQGISGSVEIANASDPFLLLLAAIVSVALILSHKLLRHAEPVLMSLYERAPFNENNADHTKKISILILLLWLLYYFYMVGMTLYFVPKLESSELTFQLTDLNFQAALFTAGVVFVLSEVFRVGHELKEENDHTV